MNAAIGLPIWYKSGLEMKTDETQMVLGIWSPCRSVAKEHRRRVVGALLRLIARFQLERGQISDTPLCQAAHRGQVEPTLHVTLAIT